jgi:hypothetical protein
MVEAPQTVLIWPDIDWPRSVCSSVVQVDELAAVLAMPPLVRF